MSISDSRPWHYWLSQDERQLNPKIICSSGRKFSKPQKAASFPDDVYPLKNVSLMDKREAPCESRGFCSSLAVLKSAAGLWSHLSSHLAKPGAGSEPEGPSEPGCGCREKLSGHRASRAPQRGHCPAHGHILHYWVIFFPLFSYHADLKV